MGRNWTRQVPDWLISVFLFLAIFIVYWASPISQSMDSRWTTHLATSIIVEHDLDFDEYDTIIPSDDYRLEKRGEHRYQYFPLGAPLMAVPFTYLYGLYDPRLYTDIESVFIWPERLAAAALTALAAVVMYLIARRRLSPGGGLIIAAVFAFATSAWSTASRGMWQHGPSMLMLSLALYLLLLARESPWIVQFAALPLAWSYVVRPTNSLSILVLTLLVFLQYRRYFLKYLAWAMLIAIPFVVLNLHFYGTLLPSYYTATHLGLHSMFGTALAANLISPGRGILVYSPILLLSLLGIYWKAKAKAFNWLDGALCAIIILHWVAVSSFPVWWAGWSFGPRFFADMMPYLVYFLIPVVAGLRRPRTHALRVTFAALLLASIFVHWRGATASGTMEWIEHPKDVNLQLERFWDWGDPQFLRGSHVLDCFLPLPAQLTSKEFRLFRTFGDAQPGEVMLVITNPTERLFEWTAEASDPLDIVQIDNQPEMLSLTVAIEPGVQMTGTHDLGSVVIHARPGQRCLLPPRTSTIESRFLLTVGPVTRTYLPLVEGAPK